MITANAAPGPAGSAWRHRHRRRDPDIPPGEPRPSIRWACVRVAPRGRDDLATGSGRLDAAIDAIRLRTRASVEVLIPTARATPIAHHPSRPARVLTTTRDRRPPPRAVRPSAAYARSLSAARAKAPLPPSPQSSRMVETETVRQSSRPSPASASTSSHLQTPPDHQHLPVPAGSPRDLHRFGRGRRGPRICPVEPAPSPAQLPRPAAASAAAPSSPRLIHPYRKFRHPLSDSICTREIRRPISCADRGLPSVGTTSVSHFGQERIAPVAHIGEPYPVPDNGRRSSAGDRRLVGMATDRGICRHSVRIALVANFPRVGWAPARVVHAGWVGALRVHLYGWNGRERL